MFAAFGVYTKDANQSKGELVKIVADNVEKESADLIKHLASLAEPEDDASSAETEMIKKDMEKNAPATAKKYIDGKNLTKKELCIILFAAFGVYTKDANHSKGELVKMVADHVEKESVDLIKNLIGEPV